MLVDEEAYADDPEGLWHADRINEHLPPTVCTLAVQRVNKRFDARYMANGRVYEYYLPASQLGKRR